MPFSGLAVYNSGVFDELREDVSDTISDISPKETPLLDRLTPPQNAAGNVLHEWLEDSLAPSTIVSSTAISTDLTGMAVHVGGAAVAGYLQVGAVIKNKTTGEHLQITGISGNTVTIVRGFGSTTPAVGAAGHEYFVIAAAALEGADVSRDTSRPRARRSNYLQIFKADIIVSGTMQSTSKLGGIADEYAYQKQQRLKEVIRDLEKAVILGKSSGNTLGSESAYRTFRGIWDSLTTNATSTGTMTPDVLDTIIQGAWDYGATDLDLIVVDARWKRAIDNFQSSRINVVQGSGYDENYKARVTQYDSTFGVMDVMLNRWMPQNSMMVISSGRIKVVPLQNRTFTHQEVARTGDSMKGMIVGEYTVEVKNQEGMAKAYG